MEQAYTYLYLLLDQWTPCKSLQTFAVWLPVQIVCQEKENFQSRLGNGAYNAVEVFVFGILRQDVLIKSVNSWLLEFLLFGPLTT